MKVGNKIETLEKEAARVPLLQAKVAEQELEYVKLKQQCSDMESKNRAAGAEAEARHKELEEKCNAQKDANSAANDKYMKLQENYVEVCNARTMLNIKYRDQAAEMKAGEVEQDILPRFREAPSASSADQGASDQPPEDDTVRCGSCGERFNFGENLTCEKLLCTYHPQQVAFEEGHCDQCGWTKLHACCHQCGTCSKGCKVGKHYAARRMTFKRAVNRLQMLRHFSGLPCKRCGMKYIEALNHDKICRFHADEIVKAGICRGCGEYTKAALECCSMCPSCAKESGGCQEGKHIPAFVVVVTSSGKNVSVPV